MILVDEPGSRNSKIVPDIGLMQHGEQVGSMSNVLNSAAQLLEVMPVIFYTLDKSWKVTYLNKKAEETVGVEIDGLLGKNLWELFPDVIRLQYFPQFHKVAFEKVSVCFEEYFPYLDKWFLIHAYPFDHGVAVFAQEL